MLEIFSKNSLSNQANIEIMEFFNMHEILIRVKNTFALYTVNIRFDLQYKLSAHTFAIVAPSNFALLTVKNRSNSGARLICSTYAPESSIQLDQPISS